MTPMDAAAERGASATGSTVVLHLFDTPSAELIRRLKPPWPPSLERLYELAHIAKPDIDVGTGVITLSAAVLALREELAHRLDLLAFVVHALEELGWDMRLEGEDLVVRSALTPEAAREQLEEHGVAGPMCVVADLDDDGWPSIRPVDAPAGGAAT